MATAAASKQLVSGERDRIFYSSMSVALALTVFVGFAPTFYLRSLFGAPPTVTGATTLSPLATLHGTLFTGWVLLFLAQTSLVASNRVALHRRMGIAGAVLAAAMVPTGIVAAIGVAARGSAPPGADPLAFLAIPLGDMVLLSIFVSLALWWRRDKEAHKRLMLMAYFSIIGAAVARIPGVILLGPPGFFGLSLLFPVAAIIYDLFSRRRVHPVYLWGVALLMASIPVRLMISGTAAWRGVAQFLVG